MGMAMMRDGRRTYTGGYVFKRGTRWYAAVTWHDGTKAGKTYKSTGIPCKRDPEGHDGTVLRRDNTGRKAALRFLDAWRAELLEAAGDLGRAGGETVTLGEYARDYVEARRGRGSISPQSARTYGKAIKSYGPLGDMTLGDLRTAEVEEWIAGCVVQGRKPNTIRLAVKLGARIYNKAVKDGLTHDNPFSEAEMPKVTRQPKNVLDEEGLHDLMRHLDECPVDRHVIGVRIAIATGMRAGEICGLRWVDADTDAGAIRVTMAAKLGETGLVVGTPKTPSSMRTIPMGRALCRTLDVWKAVQRSLLSAEGREWDDTAEYVVGIPGRGPMNPDALSAWFRYRTKRWPLIGSAGRPLCFHDLRHSFITFAIAQGVDVMAVSSIVGHASPSMTLNVYADALGTSKAEAMVAMERLLTDVETQGEVPTLPA